MLNIWRWSWVVPGSWAVKIFNDQWWHFQCRIILPFYLKQNIIKTGKLTKYNWTIEVIAFNCYLHHIVQNITLKKMKQIHLKEDSSLFHSTCPWSTFQCKNSGVRIHQSRVRCDWPPQWLIWHAHVNYYNTVLWWRLPYTDILIRFHCDMSKRNELWIYANTRKLWSTKKTIRLTGTRENQSVYLIKQKSVKTQKKNDIQIILPL